MHERSLRSTRSARIAVTAVTAISVLTAPDVAIAARAAGPTLVTMTDDDEFQPTTVHVRVGDTVRWKNVSSVWHTVTADPARAKDEKHVELPDGVAPFDSGKVRPGREWEHAFEVAGRYTYFCIPHEKDGMIGHVIVKK